MRFIIVWAAALAIPLSGCQTPHESMYSAERVCLRSGLKPGTKRFDNCANAAYAENRRQSGQATNALAIGIAAGVLGGAILGASTASTSKTKTKTKIKEERHYYYNKGHRREEYHYYNGPRREEYHYYSRDSGPRRPNSCGRWGCR